MLLNVFASMDLLLAGQAILNFSELWALVCVNQYEFQA